MRLPLFVIALCMSAHLHAPHTYTHTHTPAHTFTERAAVYEYNLCIHACALVFPRKLCEFFLICVARFAAG